MRAKKRVGNGSSVTTGPYRRKPMNDNWQQVSKYHNDFIFPNSTEEVDAWNKFYALHTLHSRVLAVAVTRIEGTWACYLAPVPGVNHDNEWFDVWKNGVKQPEELAKLLFPGFSTLPYAR